jgi:hypothetical protein
MNWPDPGNDPFYYYNSTENNARRSYYGVDYIPHFFVDGDVDGEYQYNIWDDLIEDESAISSPLVMSISGSYDEDELAGEFTVSIYAESDPNQLSLKLRVALTETHIRYVAPNGLTRHDQVFRQMIPSTSGEPFSIEPGETLEFTYDFETPSPLIADECRLVAFVQSDRNRRIVQGARVAVPDLSPTGIEGDSEMPRSFHLSQNFPNPFNAGTSIGFFTAGGEATLQVFDLTGSLVRTLADGAYESGYHTVTWDGRDEDGNEAASGVYFYRLSVPDGGTVKRMTLIR